ncbi:MAG: hypothetical protein LBQ66_15925, partial [Planctomycetaceae bacterium]|jgi:hypothetical protein|nr:hypothetical protein [Planctomycetaceae bacterium]
VVSPDIFVRGLREEAAGNFESAADLFKEFIKLNIKRTADGVLAAPYHRLAIIAWKSRVYNEANIFFQYGLKYAKDDTVKIITVDYTSFLNDIGKFEQAETILRNAVVHFPGEQTFKVELGRCLARQDRAVEALRHIRPVLGEEQAYAELASIFQSKGDYAMSNVLLQKRTESIARTNSLRTIANKRNQKIDPNNVNQIAIDRLRNNADKTAGQHQDLPFPMIASSAQSQNQINDNNLPFDPLINAVKNKNPNNNETTNTTDLITNIDGGWQELAANDNNIQPASTTEQNTNTNAIINPVYKVKALHYTIEDTAPVFLQY